MEHVVFFPSPDGAPAFRRLPSREEGLRFVEHLRNVEGVHEVSMAALTEVPLQFTAWYRAEVPAGEAASLERPAPEAAVVEAAAPPAEPVARAVVEPAAEAEAPVVPAQAQGDEPAAEAGEDGAQATKGEPSLAFFAS